MEEQNTKLYAVLNLSPEASDEEIRKTYRQCAQVYHPDKYQSSPMKLIATDNFQRVSEAYEILSDPNKRKVYDIYGMEGLISGLELGPVLNKAEEVKEIKAELKRLKRWKENEKMAAAYFQSSGTILANVSLPRCLHGDGLFSRMEMTSQIKSWLSKRSVVTIGGNLEVDRGKGGGAASAVLNHQLSKVSSIEFMASAGLRALIGVRASRQFSSQSSAAMGLSMSLKNGSLKLSSSCTRRLSKTTNGHIQLRLGSQSSVALRLEKNDQRRSATGQIEFGIGSFDTEVQYTRHFSSDSRGCIAGRVGSSSIEIEVSGGRNLSEYSTVCWSYVVGIQGIFWRFKLYRRSQKLIIPILLTTHLNPVFATGALVVPASFYFFLKKLFINPYYRKRNKQKALEKEEKISAQILERRAAAEKAHKLQQNVANRKRNRQLKMGGLVIIKALYGNDTILKNLYSSREASFESTLGVIDVTTPLNFLVDDSGQLKLHEGVKKSGIMGFCDPCPGNCELLLYVEYAYASDQYKVLVGDYEELLIPHDTHMI
ncbi:chaperone protein dnaJ 13-like isoform X1 [Cicer arietinum]|uniref:Chaperone protein dnaJ 13-like isoform X1 n=1 Tax=Cicer arietinum TaxID=3827 RepID=A0A1S2YZ47_CICAR|nr:chaperone protein dnaJ 13-like isoform X1 [Cicer arietinum]